MSGVDISLWDVSKGEYFELMFAQCKNLTNDFSEWKLSSVKSALRMFQESDISGKLPQLPKTKLEYKAYAQMFCNCKNLVEVPELPATELAAECYLCMFQGCELLTKVPKLPATNLQASCYSCMF